VVSRFRQRLKRAKSGKDALRNFRVSPPFRTLLGERGPYVLIRAANRIGKTRHLCWLVARRMVDNPGCRVRWIGPSRAQVRDVASRYLWEFLRPHVVPDQTYKDGVGFNRNNTINLRNGSLCQLKSYQDNPETHAGDEFDLIIFDEPPPRAHWNENHGRTLEREGLVVVSFTHVNTPVKWLRELVEGDEPSPTDGRTRHASGWIQYVVPFNARNCPWYSDRQVRRQVQKYERSDERDQRIYASWDGVTEGRTLAHFGDHCILPIGWQDKAEQLLPAFDQVRVGIDHGKGFGKEVAHVVGVSGRSYYILAEYSGEGNTQAVQDARGVLEAIERAGFQPYDVTRAFGDIGLGGRDPQTAQGGEHWNQRIEAGLCKILGVDRSPFHIATVNKKRRIGLRALGAINEACASGRLWVAPECLRFIHSARRFTGTEEDLKDPIDAFRYSVLDIIVDEFERDSRALHLVRR